MKLIGFFMTVYFGMNGYFGKYKLNKPYIYVWRVITWTVFTVLVFAFFSWWDRVVAFLNYVIWG